MLKAFLLGAAGYPLLELITRGRTHYSMAIAGGLSAAAFRYISRSRVCLPVRMLAGGAAVTLIEGIAGCIWNRRHHVWDYRKMPLNWRGQVCLPYTFLWTALAGLWMLIDRPPVVQQAHARRSEPHPSQQP